MGRRVLVLLACVDPWDRPITLGEECWYGHVLVEHHELASSLALVESVLVAPDFVRRDRQFDDRECFYRANVLPPPLAHLLLKVVGEFAGEEGDSRRNGSVVTAFPLPRPTRREAPKWP